MHSLISLVPICLQLSRKTPDVCLQLLGWSTANRDANSVEIGTATPNRRKARGCGDKVMQIENDYDKEVYNGDIGYIENVDPNAGEIVASFDGRSVTYGFGELDMLVPAYAATIHKSQGSEYPAVVIPVMTQHYAMLQRNLLYTGVTRGKKLVVLVGQKKAVAIAVRNVSGRRRWSKLQEWLRPNSSLSRQIGVAS